MSVFVKRVVNGCDQWLGRDRHGRAQWTPDTPSRTRFESKSAAKRAVEALIKQIVGEPEVVEE